MKFSQRKWFSNIGYVPQSIFLNDEDFSLKIFLFIKTKMIINKLYILILSIKISQLNNLVNNY